MNGYRQAEYRTGLEPDLPPFGDCPASLSEDTEEMLRYLAKIFPEANTLYLTNDDKAEITEQIFHELEIDFLNGEWDWSTPVICEVPGLDGFCNDWLNSLVDINDYR